MSKIHALWRSFFDVRPGEYLRTCFMALYLLFVLFAYYILKPVSRALFLNQFDIDKLPYLYILIAVAGGFLAFLYTRLAVKSSLKVAVGWSTALTVACLIGIWWLIGLGLDWVLYLFNVFVSLFSVVLVSQGWLVAANVFNPREAKRLYGLLGMGAVAGAAFGGTFTAQTVKVVGPRNLLLASAAMVGLAYVAFWVVTRQPGVSLAGAHAADVEEAEFHFRDILSSLARYRHLQVIVEIMLLTFIVDVTIEYQFNAMAKLAYHSKTQLTAYLGTFYGIYLNVATFAMQFFLTAAVVRRLGVGGTLQIMPVTISISAVGVFLAPGLGSSAALRLTEASTRYTLNRTAMELLYVPLPPDLKNRTKAFVDIFVDRLGRGLGGMILVLFTGVLALAPRYVALVTMGFCGGWILLSLVASREYAATVKQRLALRRLDIENARVSVADPVTLSLVERAARSDNGRQAAYALGLLAAAPGYDVKPVLASAALSGSAEARAKAYELAGRQRLEDLLEPALAEIGRASAGECAGGDGAAPRRAAACYAVSVVPDASGRLRQFLDSSDADVGAGAMDAAASQPELADELTDEWIRAAMADRDPLRRALAARACGIAGERGEELLHRLLEDADARVASAACRAAGVLRNRGYVYTLIRKLSDVRLRGAAIEALVAFGPSICGTLADMLGDSALPLAVRSRIPRVLRMIVDQRSIDVLTGALYQPEPALRHAALKALNRLRESAPGLNYSGELVVVQIHQEARQYFELNAALAALGDQDARYAVFRLLRRAVEERLRQTLDRLFRLLALRYPPRETYEAYLAIGRNQPEQHAAAVEFLDGVLDREVKKVLLPLLEGHRQAIEAGRLLCGIDVQTPEAAIRCLMRSGDLWIAACAIAAAGELRMHRLAAEIQQAAASLEPELAEVAHAAAVAAGRVEA